MTADTLQAVAEPTRRDPRERMHDQHVSVEDWRLPAQVDADRVWYSPEFRRLEGVTQVVPPQDDYVFHDRLTHSIKVAQVAATLARRQIHLSRDDSGQLSKLLIKHGLRIEDWIDPDFCYVAGLAHDIGHPPFGHAGEATLQRIAKRQDSALRERSFEGNAQSTRIVASLSFRKPQVPGLDLTLRSLAGIAKYPWLRGEHPAHVEKLVKKWSFYDDEAEILNRLVERGFIYVEKDSAEPGVIKSVHRWPEAEIMDWADDISYAVHDLEDFYRAGRIPLHRITSVLNNVPQRFLRQAEKDLWNSTSFVEISGNDEEVSSALVYARAKMKKTLDEAGNSLEAFVPDAFIQIVDVLREKMPTNKFDGSKQAHTDLQRFASEAITYLSASTRVDVIEVGGEVRLGFFVAPEARVAAEFFKAICQYFVIESSSLATMQYGQAQAMVRITEALQDMTIDWLEKWGGVSQQHSLPSRLRELAVDRLVPGETMYRENQLRIEKDLKQEGLADEEQERLRSESSRLLLEKKGEIMSCVFDYMCGLRDLQTSILDERLAGNRNSLSLSNSWLDV